MTYDPNYAPQPPRPKRKTGKILGFGCAGVLALALFGGCMAAITGGSSNDSKNTTAPTHKATTSTVPVSKECSDDVYALLLKEVKGEKTSDYRPESCNGLSDKQWSQTVDKAGDKARAAGADALSSAPAHKPKPTKKAEPKADVVTFKVWGNAPAGALGGLDIMYGSDSDNLQGTFSNGKFTATMPVNDDAMYYFTNAQLQGSGDIHCSVTIEGHTKTGHASGGYNICSAQANSGLFGDWD